MEHIVLPDLDPSGHPKWENRTTWESLHVWPHALIHIQLSRLKIAFHWCIRTPETTMPERRSVYRGS